MKVYVLHERDYDCCKIHGLVTEKSEADKWKAENNAKYPGLWWEYDEFELDVPVLATET